jgi:hypothetical protein
MSTAGFWFPAGVGVGVAVGVGVGSGAAASVVVVVVVVDSGPEGLVLSQADIPTSPTTATARTRRTGITTSVNLQKGAQGNPLNARIIAKLARGHKILWRYRPSC